MPPPPPDGRYFAAAVAQHLIDLCIWHGIPVQQLLDEQRLTRESLNPPSGRLPIETGVLLLHGLLGHTSDPQLFLKLSRASMPNGFGPVGYLLTACPTLKDCIDTLTRFEPLISNVGYSTLEHRPGEVRWTLTIDHEDPLLVRLASDFTTGVRYRFLLMLREKRSSLVRAVHFTYPAPETPAQLKEYTDTFHCPVLFDQPQTCIVLNPPALSTPLRQPDAELKEAIQSQAEKKLEELTSKPSTVDEARMALRKLLLEGQASREKLAEKLGVSGRHLGRQLENAGLGYRELLDELRMEIAREYLRQPDRTIDDTGTRLGFSDGQSFTRWFRQATGKTPGEFRQDPDA
ncbi:MAG: helix-turn-helix domain-containing protein [Pseudomonadota bacterium]